MRPIMIVEDTHACKPCGSITFTNLSNVTSASYQHHVLFYAGWSSIKVSNQLLITPNTLEQQSTHAIHLIMITAHAHPGRTRRIRNLYQSFEHTSTCRALCLYQYL